MSHTNTVARSLHDVGLAAWFGGSLMGAVALNGAAGTVADESERGRIAVDGWKRWAPVNAAAIASYLVGGLVIIKANKGRIAAQSGVASASGLKSVLTVAGLAATAAAGVLGTRVAQVPDAPAEGATEPAAGTPPSVADAQRQLHVVQWVIPGITGRCS